MISTVACTLICFQATAGKRLLSFSVHVGAAIGGTASLCGTLKRFRTRNVSGRR